MASKNGLTGKSYEEFFGKEKADKIKSKISTSVKKSMKKYKKSYIYICYQCKQKFNRKLKEKHLGQRTFCGYKCYHKWKKEHNYIRPPSRKGTKLTAEHKEILKKSTINLWKNMAFRNNHIRRMNNPETHPLRLMVKKRLSQGLKRGYISNQQEKIYIKIKNFFKNKKVELEYPLKIGKRHYYLDIAIPNNKINFEYDGSYWHQNKEKDVRRDIKLKNLGWEVFRINKYNIKNLNIILKLLEIRGI